MDKTQIRDRRTYISWHNGIEDVLHVTYTILFENGKMTDVINEFGFSIEKSSGCWDYFKRKYNQL